MSTNNENIIKIIGKLIALLEKNNVSRWVIVFKQLLHEYCDIQQRNSAVKDILNTYMGGMGSFMDLILHRDKKMLLEENDELDELRDELYDACKLYLINNGYITEIMEKLIVLLEENSASRWAIMFKQLLHEYSDIEQRDKVIKDILGTYMGMDSFADLTFQRNIIEAKHMELENLRSELYSACKAYQKTNLL